MLTHHYWCWVNQDPAISTFKIVRFDSKNVFYSYRGSRIETSGYIFRRPMHQILYDAYPLDELLTETELTPFELV